MTLRFALRGRGLSFRVSGGRDAGAAPESGEHPTAVEFEFEDRGSGMVLSKVCCRRRRPGKCDLVVGVTSENAYHAVVLPALREWSAESGLSPETLCARLVEGIVSSGTYAFFEQGQVAAVSRSGLCQ